MSHCSHTHFIHQGLQANDKTEVFFGKLILDVRTSEIQTFQLQVCLSLGVIGQDGEDDLDRAVTGVIHLSLQNDPPSAFPKVNIQILSNWGHPRFTYLYRVCLYGVRTPEWADDNATEVPGGPL